jgi:hypothetical protein
MTAIFGEPRWNEIDPGRPVAEGQDRAEQNVHGKRSTRSNNAPEVASGCTFSLKLP